MIRILNADGRPLGCSDVCRLVALAALELAVVSFQHIAGLAVVEFLEAGDPVDELEVGAIVLGVAREAGFSVSAFLDDASVESAPGGYAVANLCMASGAFEVGAPFADAMALRALGHSADRTVRFGERPGRELRSAGKCERQEGESDGHPAETAGEYEAPPQRGPPRARRIELDRMTLHELYSHRPELRTQIRVFRARVNRD